MRHLFVLDPLGQIKSFKDSSAALMQAAYRASIDVWACTPADLQARGDKAWVRGARVNFLCDDGFGLTTSSKDALDRF